MDECVGAVERVADGGEVGRAGVEEVEAVAWVGGRGGADVELSDARRAGRGNE